MTVKEICELQKKALLDRLQEQDVPITSWVEDIVEKAVIRCVMAGYVAGQKSIIDRLEHSNRWGMT